jgi:hypothetical protein
MKIVIENTDKIVHLQLPSGAKVPARVWQGHVLDDGDNDAGMVPVQVFVTRIAPEILESDPDIDRLTAQFERELQRCAPPRPTVEAIPLRLIL